MIFPPTAHFVRGGDPEKEKTPFPFAREHPIVRFAHNGDPDASRPNKVWSLAETKVYYLRHMSANNMGILLRS